MSVSISRLPDGGLGLTDSAPAPPRPRPDMMGIPTVKWTLLSSMPDGGLGRDQPISWIAYARWAEFATMISWIAHNQVKGKIDGGERLAAWRTISWIARNGGPAGGQGWDQSISWLAGTRWAATRHKLLTWAADGGASRNRSWSAQSVNVERREKGAGGNPSLCQAAAAEQVSWIRGKAEERSARVGACMTADACGNESGSVAKVRRELSNNCVYPAYTCNLAQGGAGLPEWIEMHGAMQKRGGCRRLNPGLRSPLQDGQEFDVKLCLRRGQED